MDLSRHAVLAVVSHGCPPPKDRYLRVTHPSATDSRSCPCDLHVLSMPPAFALSQDQTLRFIPHQAKAQQENEQPKTSVQAIFSDKTLGSQTRGQPLDKTTLIHQDHANRHLPRFKQSQIVKLQPTTSRSPRKQTRTDKSQARAQTPSNPSPITQEQSTYVSHKHDHPKPPRPTPETRPKPRNQRSQTAQGTPPTYPFHRRFTCRMSVPKPNTPPPLKQ